MYLKRNNELSVLTLYLGNYSNRFYLREISRLTKFPLKNTQNILNNLEKNKILKSTIHGKNKYFRLNLDNILTKFYLLYAEVYRTMLFLEKYPQLKPFVKELGPTVIIFGSFAKFSANKDSDLDLLVIENDKKLPFHLIPFEIHEIKMSKKTFLKALEKQEPLIKEIEDNHIILSNHPFYLEIMWEKYAK